MTTGEGTYNQVTGTATTVLQAGHIHGNVHIHNTSPMPVPRQLPRDLRTFIARKRELAKLDDTVRAAADDPTPIRVVTGPPGVGKTALVIHWAHRVRDHFPDGQLYANLRGYDCTDRPLEPGPVLEDFLRTLDIPADRLPVLLDAKAGLFRSLLTGRRMLLVLDNARTSDQVRPLLPTSAHCTVVITTRNMLSGIVSDDGAIPIPLRPLSRRSGIALLKTTLHPTPTDIRGLARLTELCGGLPLALRIVSQRLQSSPHQTVQDLADGLAEEYSRLDELTAPENSDAVHTVFSWSYDELPPPTARVFRLLGLHPGPHFSTETASALVGLPVPLTRRSLATLSAAHLLEHTAQDRYQFHDLLRLFAADRAVSESDDTERRDAVHRVLLRYLTLTASAAQSISPFRSSPAEDPSHQPFDSYDAALAWLDVERPNLVAAVRHAAREQFPALAWRLAGALRSYFDLRKPQEDRNEVLRIGLVSAERSNDRRGVGLMLLDLGSLKRDQGAFDDVIRLCGRAFTALQEVGDAEGSALCLQRIGDAHRDLGKAKPALEFTRRALAEWQKIGDRDGEAWTLRNLGLLHRDLHEYADALAAFERACDLFEEAGDLRGRGSALRNIGVVQGRLGDLDSARRSLEEALSIQRAAGDEWNEACTLERLGETLRDDGKAALARTAWTRASALFQRFHDHRLARIQALLHALEG